MKSIGNLLKSTALGGIVFLLPLVLLAVILEKAFKIIKVLSDPLANLLPFDALAGYAVADILAVLILFLITLVAGLLAKSPIFDGVYQKLDAIILQVFPGYSWIKGMTGSLSDTEAQEFLKPVVAVQDDVVQMGYEVERLPHGWVAVYIPGAPNSRSGSVAYFTEDRIRSLDTNFAGLANCLKTLGRGSSGFVTGLPEHY